MTWGWVIDDRIFIFGQLSLLIDLKKWKESNRARERLRSPFHFTGTLKWNGDPRCECYEHGRCSSWVLRHLIAMHGWSRPPRGSLRRMRAIQLETGQWGGGPPGIWFRLRMGEPGEGLAGTPMPSHSSRTPRWTWVPMETRRGGAESPSRPQRMTSGSIWGDRPGWKSLTFLDPTLTLLHNDLKSIQLAPGAGCIPHCVTFCLAKPSVALMWGALQCTGGTSI